MATNQKRYVGNTYGIKDPLIMLGKFQAGGSQAIKEGEILIISSTNWIPATSDVNGAGDMAIAAEEIRSGDLAGYYKIIVPRPGDIFEYPLDTGAATAVGTGLKVSDSETVTTTGSNNTFYACGQDHYPKAQNHASDGNPADNGTTIRSKAKVLCMMEAGSSYYSTFNK